MLDSLSNRRILGKAGILLAVKNTGSKKKKKAGKSAPAEHYHPALQPETPRTRWQLYYERFEELREKIHKKGRERLTIMVIPHTEKKILNFHVSIYTISGVIAAVVLVMVFSMVSLVGKSGEDIQFYEMGLTTSQFNIQSTRMAEEMIPLHDIVNRYTNTIAELQMKLNGEKISSAQGGASQAVVDSEITDLQKSVEKCRSLGDNCDQKLTEEILRKLIYLSRQDNQNLRRAVEMSDSILGELKSREMQNLLRNTPGIWPAKGYLLSPYGWQIDQITGKRIFRNGIEIGAVAGAEVVATAPGTVKSISYDENYGLHVWIEHRFGIKTLYAHLDRVEVQANDRVSRGQTIGRVGRSGNAPLPELYYEVHVGTVAYNPHAFLNHLQDQWLIQPKL